jgi:antitoxin PrlF
MTSRPDDQRWFWTEQWQAGEVEATAHIAVGQTKDYADAQSMFDDLDRRRLAILRRLFRHQHG